MLNCVMIPHPDLSDASWPGETRPPGAGVGRGGEWGVWGVGASKPSRARKGLSPSSAGGPSGVSTQNTGADWEHHTASRGPIWTTETVPLGPVICLPGGFPRLTVSNISKKKMQQRFQMPPWRTQAGWKLLPVLIVRITHLLGLWLGKTICSRSKQWSLLTAITLAL